MNNFWKEWIKLVVMLVASLLVWIAFIFICDRYFGKTFEEMRFIHYFIFMMLIMKAKNIFLKKVKSNENEESK